MGLRTVLKRMSRGIQIPYMGTSADGSDGFVDLRGRPHEVDGLAVRRSSGALHDLLVRLADAGAAWFSVGCDLGAHIEPQTSSHRRQIAGGYLHVVAAAFAERDAEHYLELTKALRAGLAAKVANRTWDLVFILQPVEMTLDGREATRCASLSIVFYASERTRQAAERSREALLRSITDTMFGAANPRVQGGGTFFHDVD